MQRNKKIATKRQAWNKGLVIGKRDGFTPAQVKRIRGLLDDRGAAGLRDLALFTTAIDTMLHGQDLLKITVKDVQSRNGSVRSVIEVAQSRRAPPVRCALSRVAIRALEKWGLPRRARSAAITCSLAAALEIARWVPDS